jgi:hypothetical protein
MQKLDIGPGPRRWIFFYFLEGRHLVFVIFPFSLKTAQFTGDRSGTTGGALAGRFSSFAYVTHSTVCTVCATILLLLTGDSGAITIIART